MSEAIRAFIAKLPPGDGRVGCNYLLFAFNRGVEKDMELPEFEREVAKVTKTSTVYGRRFIDGVDVKGVRAVYLESFTPRSVPPCSELAPQK
jgi:hypothetical protein